MRYKGVIYHVVRRNDGERSLGRPVHRYKNYNKMGIKGTCLTDIILHSVSSPTMILYLQH
jgi:hypothetical protein